MATRPNRCGDFRGMMYTPKWADCDDCGAPIWKDAPNRKLCKKCQMKHQMEREQKARERAIRYYCKKVGKEMPSPEKIKNHECEASEVCKYGSGYKGCNYHTITGRLRTSGGGHKIVNGACDLFEPRPKGQKPGWMANRDEKLTEGGGS